MTTTKSVGSAAFPGLRPSTPGFIAFRQNHHILKKQGRPSKMRGRPMMTSAPDGARVASLQSPILRPGNRRLHLSDLMTMLLPA